MAKSIRNRLRKEQTPIIDGNIATFVWLGDKAPDLIGDFTGWDDGNPCKMKKSEAGIWTYQLEFPTDAYIEYAFSHGAGNLSDPHNPRSSSNGMGSYNSYFSMPEYRPTSLTQKIRRIPHGIVTSYQVPTDYLVTGKYRTIRLYQPPVDFPVPLLVVWDGQDYLYRAKLCVMIDNMIAQGRIQPVALALINNGGQKTRHLEYSCSDATLGLLMTGVLPLATKHLNLIDITQNPGAYGVAGASMGGLMALYTGVRLSQVFGNVISQSGAFSWAGIDLVVFDLLEHREKLPIKIWMDVGIYDIPSLLVSNRKMKDLLIMRDYQPEYREYNAGHNYPAWRDDIWRGLEYLYGIYK
jgi:enterochelin esterase family protein